MFVARATRKKEEQIWSMPSVDGHMHSESAAGIICSTNAEGERACIEGDPPHPPSLPPGLFNKEPRERFYD